MDIVTGVALVVAGVAAIVWGAELFAEHLSTAAARLGVSSFALVLLLAGAEPEESATAVAASLRDAPGVAFGDVVGANVTIFSSCRGRPRSPSCRSVPRCGSTVGGVIVASLGAWCGAAMSAGGRAGLVGAYVAFVVVIGAGSVGRRSWG